MKTGWYLSNGEAWYWDNRQREFTDHLTECAVQWSYVEDADERDVERMTDAFRSAKTQLDNPFTGLDGPYKFDEICDGKRLLQP